jgi:signal transduction histidine kinase
MTMTGAISRLPRGFYGLSARLLVLTAIFVMAAEVLIFLPSVARFRIDWMNEKISAAHLAILSLEATPDHMISDDLKTELLHHAGVHAIVISKPPVRRMLTVDQPPPAQGVYDLRSDLWYRWIADTVRVLVGPEHEVIRIVGVSPQDGDSTIEILLDAGDLYEQMLTYGERILALSAIISLITAAMVYLSLHWLIIRPMRRLTEDVIGFRRAPADPTRAITPTQRRDEIGIMQRELSTMENAVRSAMRQQMRLAALGSAVAKINHDLRNILTTAQLVSDRLADSTDANVRHMAPMAVSSIDRAVRLCSQTLDYARDEMPAPVRTRFALATLVDDVGQVVLLLTENRAQWQNQVPVTFELDADRDQMFRVLVNLGRNAAEAGATYVRIRTTLKGADRAIIEITDDGPGLPPKAKEKLFTPFAGSARPGGTGLGLAIARELIQTHGGTLTLARSDAEGTVFRIELSGAHGGAQTRAAE